MERSKWNAVIKGAEVRGFCRSHESQYKVVAKSMNSTLPQLLKADRDVMIVKQSADSASVDMAVSVEGSHFRLNIPDLLFASQSDSNLLELAMGGPPQ